MKLGIVGLPNVGKSTLFNSLTKAGAESANYPFCTIDPNVGVVAVPDERLKLLGDMYNSKKVTPAVIEFVDIAGLVKGASKGEGLGNQFLANIREVDAIVHVVRCFEDPNVVHVDGSVDPARDIETINLELIFSDIEILDRRIAKTTKGARMDKKLAKELELLQKIKAHLEDGKLAKTFEVGDDEDDQEWFASYNLLTAKPVIYAANVSEDDLADDGANNPHVAKQMGIPIMKTLLCCGLIAGIFFGCSAFLTESYSGRATAAAGLSSISNIFQALAAVLLAQVMQKKINITIAIPISTILIMAIFNVQTQLGVRSGTYQQVVLGAIVLIFGIIAQRGAKGVVK